MLSWKSEYCGCERGRRRLPRGPPQNSPGPLQRQKKKVQKDTLSGNDSLLTYIVAKRPFHPHFPHFLHLASVQEVQEVRVVSTFNNYYSGIMGTHDQSAPVD